MKILTIIFNLGLFGIACIGLLTRGSSSQPLNPVFAFLLLLVPILNIVFMLGSRVNYSTPPFSDKIKSSREQTETGKSSSGYMLVKIIAVILNLVLPCDHNTGLCQYEIHKAIVSIEHKWLGVNEKNVFGSWARLNK